MTIDPGDHRWTTTTEVLLRCGMFAGPLFIVTFLIEGLARPDYHPLRHPVSSLALGPGGWIQVANFMVAGVLYLALAVGLLRARREYTVGPGSGAVLIGAAGVGLLGSGAFITDPVSGYPPGGDPRPPGHDVATDGSGHHLDLTRDGSRGTAEAPRLDPGQPASQRRRPGSRTHRKGAPTVPPSWPCGRRG